MSVGDDGEVGEEGVDDGVEVLIVDAKEGEVLLHIVEAHGGQDVHRLRVSDLLQRIPRHLQVLTTPNVASLRRSDAETSLHRGHPDTPHRGG